MFITEVVNQLRSQISYIGRPHIFRINFWLTPIRTKQDQIEACS